MKSEPVREFFGIKKLKEKKPRCVWSANWFILLKASRCRSRKICTPAAEGNKHTHHRTKIEAHHISKLKAQPFLFYFPFTSLHDCYTQNTEPLLATASVSLNFCLNKKKKVGCRGRQRQRRSLVCTITSLLFWKDKVKFPYNSTIFLL